MNEGARGGAVGGWITRLRAGLKRSSATLAGGLAAIFSGRPVDAATVQELEDLLIMADLGPATAARLARAATARQFDGE
ncbi:MAG: signal recognition particle receptor subunit alpha, partial [Alphaproteobacteria bacterium]|nr:signal recognition particle receptor subunit alpha [Alphaproteobacteria bacterium]